MKTKEENQKRTKLGGNKNEESEASGKISGSGGVVRLDVRHGLWGYLARGRCWMEICEGRRPERSGGVGIRWWKVLPPGRRRGDGHRLVSGPV